MALTQTAAIATSVYLHRALAHRALTVHPIADVLFRIVLWLTTGLNRRAWGAGHRKHHAFTAREGGPPTPRLLRLWRGPAPRPPHLPRPARKAPTTPQIAPA